MNTHFIQGITVLVLFAVGWGLGTYFIARRAKGARERRFTLQAGTAVLLGIFAFSALDFFVLKSSGAGIGAFILFTIVVLRRRQLQIRREEANA